MWSGITLFCVAFGVVKIESVDRTEIHENKRADTSTVFMLVVENTETELGRDALVTGKSAEQVDLAEM